MRPLIAILLLSFTQATASNITTPTIPQPTVTTLGGSIPTRTDSTTVGDGTDDMYCSKATLPSGSASIGHASIWLAGAVVGTATSVCVYNSDGSILELAAPNINTNSATEISTAVTTAAALGAGAHWLCLGTDAAITPKGTVLTVGVGVAAFNSTQTGAGGSCPTAIALGSFSATAQIPEIALTP